MQKDESGAADGVLQEDKKGAIQSLSLAALLAKDTLVDDNEKEMEMDPGANNQSGNPRILCLLG